MKQKEPIAIVKKIHDVVFRRRLAQLGGTSTWGDCLVALRQLMNPGALVEGRSIAEYEKAFAQRLGMRYAHSFSAGRVGLYGLLKIAGER